MALHADSRHSAHLVPVIGRIPPVSYLAAAKGMVPLRSETLFKEEPALAFLYIDDNPA
jgi:hypothetical protein